MRFVMFFLNKNAGIFGSCWNFDGLTAKPNGEPLTVVYATVRNVISPSQRVVGLTGIWIR